jgi:DNA-binding transcriptional regulator YiaG
MSQEEQLAHALNISYVTAKRWENGKIEPNKMAKMVFYALCEKNGVAIPEERDGK